MSRRGKIAIGIMLVIVGLIVYGLVSLFNSYPNKPLDNTGGMFEASATILTLVGVGSIVGLQLNPNRPPSHSGGIGLLLVCGGAVVFIQTAIMLGLCCFVLYTHTYALLMIGTAICLVMAFIGVLSYINNQGESSSSS